MDKQQSERIRKLRKEKHLTQKEVADAIHCHVKHYSAMENAKRSITRETANALSHVFDVSEAYILGETVYRTEAEKHAATEAKLFNIITNSDGIERVIRAHGYEITFIDDTDQSGFLNSYSIEIRNSNGHCCMSKSRYESFKQTINDVVEGLLLLEIKREGHING